MSPPPDRFRLASVWSRSALIHERGHAWPTHVARREIRDLKAGLLQELADVSVEMTSPDDPLPERGQPVLPSGNARIGSGAMLDEEKFAGGLENPADVLKRPGLSRASMALSVRMASVEGDILS